MTVTLIALVAVIAVLAALLATQTRSAAAERARHSDELRHAWNQANHPRTSDLVAVERAQNATPKPAPAPKQPPAPADTNVPRWT